MEQFILKVSNQELYTFAIEYAKKKGVPVYEGTYKDRETDFGEYPYLKYDVTYVVGAQHLGRLPIINIEQFVEWCDKYKNSTLKLNSSYVAEIDYAEKIVKVGCQSFSFKKVEELYNLIKQNKNHK